MQIYMQMAATEDNPGRFYHLMLHKDLLEGWTLIREWGCQGYTGRVRREFHTQREEAVRAMTRARDEQVGRGYRVVFTQGEAPPE